MGEPSLTFELRSEAALVELAGGFARALWARRVCPLVIGLGGDLGSGKTTWARGMLRGLNYGGRVPSPTYMLLEEYRCDGLNVIHLDLYRLSGDEELENLGVRDWLDDPTTWIVVEWPERAPHLARRCDLDLQLAVTGPAGRRVAVTARSPAGIEALGMLRQVGFKNDS